MQKTKSKEEYYSYEEIFSTTYYTFDKIRFYCSQNKSYNQAIMIDIYLFYCKCASIQETNSVFATNKFVSGGLGYDDKTITKYTKILQELGLIERTARRDLGKIIGHYVTVKFVLKKPEVTTPPLESGVVQSHAGLETPPNTVYIKEEIQSDIKQLNTNDINTDKTISYLKEGSSSNNPPSSARPPKQAGIDKFGMSKALIDLCPSCDREPNFLLKRIEEWLELDTWENILTGYTNYCKKYGKSSQRPTTIIKNGEYKKYIEEKVKPSKLTKYEERLNNPTWRSHPTVDRQYKGLLDEEYKEYSALSMDYYGEVMQENKFIWYPL